jgi:hypothetical protein
MLEEKNARSIVWGFYSTFFFTQAQNSVGAEMHSYYRLNLFIIYDEKLID